MRGSYPQKHPSLLVGHRRHRIPVPAERGTEQPPPPPPKGLLPLTRSQWRKLWRSPVARTWDRDADLLALMRYIGNVDRWLRYEKLVNEVPIVRGSVGQVRPNPLAKRMDALEEQIRAAEDRFGLNAAGRLRLGIEVLETRRGLADLRAELMASDDDYPEECFVVGADGSRALDLDAMFAWEEAAKTP